MTSDLDDELMMQMQIFRYALLVIVFQLRTEIHFTVSICIFVRVFIVM